jgi:hypothetical protein
MIKARKMKCSGHVARMGEQRHACRIFVGKAEGKSVGQRNLSDVTRNSTRRCVLRMSDSALIGETEGSAARVKY